MVNHNFFHLCHLIHVGWIRYGRKSVWCYIRRWNCKMQESCLRSFILDQQGEYSSCLHSVKVNTWQTFSLTLAFYLNYSLPFLRSSYLLQPHLALLLCIASNDDVLLMLFNRSGRSAKLHVQLLLWAIQSQIQMSPTQSRLFCHRNNLDANQTCEAYLKPKQFSFDGWLDLLLITWWMITQSSFMIFLLVCSF